MCGIAGIIALNPGSLIPREKILSFLDSMNHRGPDANGSYIQPYIHLYHTRLSIIDVGDSANQPFINQSGRYVL
jgi:asparagine synthase (glutamine-hydrolysing)